MLPCPAAFLAMFLALPLFLQRGLSKSRAKPWVVLIFKGFHLTRRGMAREVSDFLTVSRGRGGEPFFAALAKATLAVHRQTRASTTDRGFSRCESLRP
jgi:hypothetical protein